MPRCHDSNAADTVDKSKVYMFLSVLSTSLLYTDLKYMFVSYISYTVIIIMLFAAVMVYFDLISYFSYNMRYFYILII